MPLALAAAHAHPKPSTTHSPSQAAAFTAPSIASSPAPPETEPEFSYPQLTQTQYTARWGTHDPRHTRRAAALVRSFANFGDFPASRLRLTPAELRVLDVLEACLAGDAYWAARGAPRPRAHDAHPRAPAPETRALQETWDCAPATALRARAAGRTLRYRKTWGTRGGAPALLLTAAVPDTDDAPHDAVDAAHAFADYACSAAFAAAHGALDAFEHGTLCVLRRHVVWWEHEARLRALERPGEKAKPRAGAVYPTRDASSVRNTTVVLPRRTVRLV